MCEDSLTESHRISTVYKVMPVSYGVARWPYGGDTVCAGKATGMPRNKPALFRTPVRPGEPRLF